MSAKVTFVEDLPEPKGRRAYDEVLANLRSRPMQWAEIERPDGWTRSNAYVRRQHWTQQGYEVEVRHRRGVVRVFARYTGEVPA